MAVPILPFLAGLWSQSKWVVILGALIGSHYFAYSKGRESILREQSVTAQAPALKKETKKAADRAASDTARLKDLELQNEKLLAELDAFRDRPLCPVDDDGMRLLREVQESTKHR